MNKIAAEKTVINEITATIVLKPLFSLNIETFKAEKLVLQAGKIAILRRDVWGTVLRVGVFA